MAPLAGERRESFEQTAVGLGLADKVRVLPLVPHWRMPAFLRSCTAVCVLERDFPIELHGPLTPREVLACGSCLVVSAEVAAKQTFSEPLQNGKHALIVNDPRDHDELAAVLSQSLINRRLSVKSLTPARS